MVTITDDEDRQPTGSCADCGEPVYADHYRCDTCLIEHMEQISRRYR